ncbi:MAG: ABC transporter permease [bacterium]|nr:ABC transporter permease [bacterium]
MALSRQPAARRIQSDVLGIVRQNAVPLLFLALGLAGVLATGMNPYFLANETINRLARNSFLVLSLLIPVTAGLGLNFGIVLGAMAGQAALIAVTHWRIPGLSGLGLALALCTPLAVGLGWFAGMILNRAKGREMITSMILGFFMNGVYQLVFLFLVGTAIPMRNPAMLLTQGVGLRNTQDLELIRWSLDRLVYWRVSGFSFPVLTLLAGAALCAVLMFLARTKLGQDFRAVGQDMHVAEVAGINVDRTRIIAVIISTTLAAWGQVIFLQNIGTLNTYNSHEQVGMFAIAALLVGGATVARATVANALVGTFLFHLLFIVSPFAGQRLLGQPQVGEYFRVFVAYGVIAVALGLHAWQKRQQVLRALARDKLAAAEVSGD